MFRTRKTYKMTNAKTATTAIMIKKIAQPGNPAFSFRMIC
jgi:hypothetical protein